MPNKTSFNDVINFVFPTVYLPLSFYVQFYAVKMHYVMKGKTLTPSFKYSTLNVINVE